MKAIAQQRIGNTTFLIGLDGKPVPHRDSENYILHIFPMLYAPDPKASCEDFKLIEAWLVMPDGNRKSVIPEDEVISRSPYPDKSYIVAGTPKNQMGWSVPLDIENHPKQLIFHWSYEEKSPRQNHWSEWELIHIINLELIPSPVGHVFTTHNHAPYPLIQGYINPNHYNSDFRPDPTLQFEQVDNKIVTQCFAQIQSCAWSDRDFDAFEDAVYLRDVEHQVAFRNHVELFNQSACIEMPPEIFNRAVHLGQLGPGLNQAKCEYHPAVKVLCDWWNQNAPNPDCRCAGSFEIFCRVEDNGHLWAAYQDTPNINLNIFTKYQMQQSIARVGNHTLILFLKPMAQCEDHESWHSLIRVDGEYWVDVGAPVSEAENAWYALSSLQNFKVNYPAIARAISSTA